MTAPTTLDSDVALLDAVRCARPVVWLDDDPTGTQAVYDLPVLTSWRPQDVAWAIRQRRPGFFVLTNTRSLDRTDAAHRVRDVVETCLAVGRRLGVSLAFGSRGDSTLRSNFPAETDAIIEVLARHGVGTDALVLAPAFPEAGRVTIDGVHHVRGPEGLRPVAQTQYAQDATFGYTSSDLGAWAREKTGRDLEVVRVRPDSSMDGPEADGPFNRHGSGGERVLVVDAQTEQDLRAVVLPLLRAEQAGGHFVYQVGPAFVGARSGQTRPPLVHDDHLARIVDRSAHGLVVVGSHVDRSTRQLRALRDARDVATVELDVGQVLARPDECVQQAVDSTLRALAEGPAVLTTSRGVVRGGDAASSLHIARQVSDALSRTVREVMARHRPAYLVAKGGITSSQIATDALGIRRAWVVGTMLPGLVSLWRADEGPAAGLPFVVFAGNVGEDDALLRVVARLEGSR